MNPKKINAVKILWCRRIISAGSAEVSQIKRIRAIRNITNEVINVSLLHKGDALLRHLHREVENGNFFNNTFWAE